MQTTEDIQTKGPSIVFCDGVDGQQTHGTSKERPPQRQAILCKDPTNIGSKLYIRKNIFLFQSFSVNWTGLWLNLLSSQSTSIFI